MIAAALAALNGLGAVRWIWARRRWLTWLATGLVVAALLGLWRWERHDRIAAEATAKAATIQLDLASADARRWHAASDLRDQAIAALGNRVAQQNAAVAKLQFGVEHANRAAAQAEAETRDARLQLDQRIKDIENEAKSHPERIAPLGPIVLGRVDRLWD